MQTDASRLWLSRIVTFTMSALAAASAAYWGLKAWGPPMPAAAPAMALAWAPPVGPKALALVLGGGLAAPVSVDVPAAVSRYALLGVVAGHSHGSAALISVDGQEAKPVRLGASVEGGMVLKSVQGRRAVLSSAADGAELALELPALNGR